MQIVHLAALPAWGGDSNWRFGFGSAAQHFAARDRRTCRDDDCLNRSLSRRRRTKVVGRSVKLQFGRHWRPVYTRTDGPDHVGTLGALRRYPVGVSGPFHGRLECGSLSSAGSGLARCVARQPLKLVQFCIPVQKIDPAIMQVVWREFPTDIAKRLGVRLARGLAQIHPGLPQ